MDAKDITRFWSKVEKTPTCWIWKGQRHKQGYGYFWVGTKLAGRDQIASRVAYEITHGSIPEGMDVLHHCDNPACVRPDHLWAGTHSDNMRDMLAKGRRHERRHENHHNAKLTWAAVREIRRRYVRGIVTCKILAHDYGVDQALIHRVIQNKVWIETPEAQV